MFLNVIYSVLATFPRGPVIVRLEEDVDVGGVAEGWTGRVTVAGPGLAQGTVRVVEPEVVPGTEVAHTGGGLQVVVTAGEHQLVPGGRLEVVGAALALWVVGRVVGGLEDPALPSVEADSCDCLTRGGTGGRAEGSLQALEHQPALGGGVGGGGEVDGEDGGGGEEE